MNEQVSPAAVHKLLQDIKYEAVSDDGSDDPQFHPLNPGTLARINAMLADLQGPPWISDTERLRRGLRQVIAHTGHLPHASSGFLAERMRHIARIAKEALTNTPIAAPLECTVCGSATGTQHPIDGDHAGWVCPACYAKAREDDQ